MRCRSGFHIGGERVALPDLSSVLLGLAPVEQPPPTPGVRGLTRLAVGVVIVLALYFGKDVLLPVTLAVLLASPSLR